MICIHGGFSTSMIVYRWLTIFIRYIYMIYYVYVLFMWTDKRIEVHKARYNLYQQLISRVGWFSHSVFVIIVSSSHISYNHCHGGALAIYGEKHVKWLVLVNLTRLFGIMLVLECWTLHVFTSSIAGCNIFLKSCRANGIHKTPNKCRKANF